MVHVISTFHTDDMMEKRYWTRAVTEGVETVQKPVMIDEYNLHMRGVDKSDQFVLYYGYTHRSQKVMEESILSFTWPSYCKC